MLRRTAGSRGSHYAASCQPAYAHGVHPHRLGTAVLAAAECSERPVPEREGAFLGCWFATLLRIMARRACARSAGSAACLAGAGP